MFLRLLLNCGKKENLICTFFCVWGCKAEVRIYNLQIKKLDPKTISGYFIGYCIGSRGSRFFCPSQTTRIMELDIAIYFEDDFGFDGSNGPREPRIREESVFIPSVPVLDRDVIDLVVDEPVIGQYDPFVDEQDIPTIADASVTLRRSQRTMRSVIPDDYDVYLHEHDFDISDDSNLITYEEAINSLHSKFWLNAMENEMKSMASNGVWDLVELPDGSKPIWCKWVFKTKRD